MRKSPKIRDIKPEQLNIGDLISVTFHDGDLTITRTGKIALREQDHQGRQTHYFTAEGKPLFTWFRDGLVKQRIRLIYRDDSVNWLAGIDI